ncbi:hypothetical protein [Mucilaginibacter sp. HD30]
MKTHQMIIPCGLLLVAACLFIRYWVGRRRFNRRGFGGVEHFGSYSSALVIRFLECLLLLIANILGLTGLFLLLIAGLA